MNSAFTWPTAPPATGLTANPWQPHAARICRITRERPDTLTYELELEDAATRAAYRFLPGQFNMLYLPGFGESAISISSDPGQLEAVGHTVHVCGNVTRALARRREGDQVLLRGPFGSAWPLTDCLGRDLVLVAGGIGLAPLRPALLQIVRRRGDYGRVCLLFGARSPAGLLYVREFAQWREADIRVEVTVDLADAGWRGHIGVVPTLFHLLRLNSRNTSILTCGPEIMMRFVIFEALARSVAPEQIFVSLERNMQCAVGFCGHCQLGPAFVCRNGPVFSYAQMEPYLHVRDL